MFAVRFFACTAAALTLAACNSTAPPPSSAAAPPAAITIAPADFALPPGGGCSGDIARYRALVASDLTQGHVDKPVHDQIQIEAAKADMVCQAGRAGEAAALLRASKLRHGYPV